MKTRRPRLPVILYLGTLALLSFCFVPPVRAATLDEAITNLADHISDYLDEKGQRSIMLKSFDGPGAATAGRAISASLKEALKEKDAQVVPLGANWTVRGEFSFEQNGSFAIVLIKANLFDNSGKEISGFREKVKVEEVRSIEDISRLLGLTVDLDEEQEAVANVEKGKSDTGTQLISKTTDLAEKLVSSVVQPVFSFRNDLKTEVSADPNSKFRIEILVKRGFQGQYEAVPIENAGGFPFAALQAKDVYKIRVHNDADHAIGVKLSIDGINSFCLCDNQSMKDRGTWYFPARSSGVISGWYVTPTLLREFIVTSKGEALGLPDASDIGTVTVQFFHSWTEGEQPPAVELLASKRGQLRTGVGLDITREANSLNCFFGDTLLSSVSIRYSNPDDLPPE